MQFCDRRCPGVPKSQSVTTLGKVPEDGDDADIDAVDMERMRRLLSEEDGANSPLLDPPPPIWEAIQAGIRAEPAAVPPQPDLPPKEPPFRRPPLPLVVEYRIDDDDMVAQVGRDWADFARDNDAPQLAVPTSDRTLWSYIDNDEIREMWQLLVGRVRATQTEARVPFRCDAPHARRWFEMAIVPEADNHVRFRSVLIYADWRPPVALLDLYSERDAGAQPVVVCSWCGRGQHGSGWLDIEELVEVDRLLERASMPPISHGICGSCRDEMAAELLVGEAGG